MIRQRCLYLIAWSNRGVRNKCKKDLCGFCFVFTGDFRYLVSPQAGIKGCETISGKLFSIFSFLLFPIERRGLLGS